MLYAVQHHDDCECHCASGCKFARFLRPGQLCRSKNQGGSGKANVFQGIINTARPVKRPQHLHIVGIVKDTANHARKVNQQNEDQQHGAQERRRKARLSSHGDANPGSDQRGSREICPKQAPGHPGRHDFGHTRSIPKVQAAGKNHGHRQKQLTQPAHRPDHLVVVHLSMNNFDGRWFRFIRGGAEGAGRSKRMILFRGRRELLPRWEAKSSRRH